MALQTLPLSANSRQTAAMPTSLYLAFIVAAVILILIPGPNVALIVANSVAHGARYGLLTVAGTSAAMALQLGLIAFGLTTLISGLAEGFGALRWIGAAYLIWLGMQTWRAPPANLTRSAPQPRTARTTFLTGFLVSLTNPKTLLFYSAFLPQFIDPTHDMGRQFAILSLTFLALATALDCGWALLAGRFRVVLAINGRLRNRLSGGLLIGAGLGLALARKA